MKRRPQLASRSSELACRWKKSPSRRASNGWPRHSRRKIARPDPADTRGDRTAHQRRGKDRSDAIRRNDRAVGRAANGRRGAEVRNRPKDATRLASFQRPQIAFDRPNLPFRSRPAAEIETGPLPPGELILRQAAAWIEHRDAMGLTFAPIPQHEIGVFVGRAAHATGGEQARRSRRDQSIGESP